MTEFVETDNDFTDWFVWTPLDLANQVPVLRNAPPVRTPLGGGPYESCDGFRSPGYQGSYWTAIGMIPTSMSNDYDVRLHTASVGSKDGFGSSLAWSADPFAGNPDFCIVNFNMVPGLPFDASVTNWSGSADGFYVQRADAPYYGIVPAGLSRFGPMTLDAHDCLDIHTTVREHWGVVDHSRRRNADWLQEYFIPRDRFLDFIGMARPILAGGGLRVLNTTVRVVHENREAFLSYARQDAFSFVIFFEQKLDAASIRRTEAELKRLLDCALACGGCHYLCYQRVANPAQLAKAYPRIGAFFEAKRRYDPDGLFLNDFHRQYAPAFAAPCEATPHVQA